MFVIHALAPDVWSIALKHPDPTSPLAWDFGTAEEVALDADDVVSWVGADASGAGGCFFGPDMVFGNAAVPLARANPEAKVLRMRPQRQDVPTDFVSGYTSYARDAALFWREHGVTAQPLLVAGTFALASVQVPIAQCLRFCTVLTPYLVRDKLPSYAALQKMSMKVADGGLGLGLDKAGPLRGFYEYRHTMLAAMQESGLHDDALRRHLALVVGNLPSGLALTKLSFILALVGNDTGCLDARILEWVFDAEDSKAFSSQVGGKATGGRAGPTAYARYRHWEKDILENCAFYDPKAPLPLAQAQWALWESLGPDPADRIHTHEEAYRAVRDNRLNLEFP